MTKEKLQKVPAKPIEEGIRPEDYNQVVKCAKLVTIQLRKHEFDVKAEFYDSTAKKKLGFDRRCIGVIYDDESHVVASTYQFFVSAKAARKSVLKSVADYLVMYEFDEAVNPEAAEAFCKRVGLYAAYPYYRALVAQLSAAANLDLPTLPMIATSGSRLPVSQVSQEEPATT